MNIYLLCTGNTCRSPMAEAILRSKNIENCQFDLLAFMHRMDFTSADNARTLIEEADMPYTKKSRALSREDVEWADYIFTMTESHKRALLQLFPEKKKRYIH